MSPRIRLSMTVNGKARRVSVPPMKRLLDVLRDECGLTGTKEGCGEGECGACTVMLDGAPVNACLVPAIHAQGAKVVTVEGLARGRRLSALQLAFVEGGGSQCGMCTPGMLVAAVAVLNEARGRVPSDDDVRRGLAGTLCRCTGYQKIVDAVRAAARPGANPAGARIPAASRRVKAAPTRTPAPRRRTKVARAATVRTPGARGAGRPAARRKARS